MINFVGFEAIIDQIGGIDIDVEEYVLHELNKYIGLDTGGEDYENAIILNDFIFNDTLPDFTLNRSTEEDSSNYFEYIFGIGYGV